MTEQGLRADPSLLLLRSETVAMATGALLGYPRQRVFIASTPKGVIEAAEEETSMMENPERSDLVWATTAAAHEQEMIRSSFTRRGVEFRTPRIMFEMRPLTLHVKNQKLKAVSTRN